MKIQPKTLSGFMELLPNDQIKFEQMKNSIKKSYEKFGFLPLDTPIIEMSEVLLAKAGGETEKQIYRFTKGENDLALRFDLTVPLAKYVAQYSNELHFPFRRYQIGKVYRGERPQRGRFREFYQCDIDIIGDGELPIIIDAEIPSIIYTTFKDLGFDAFTICINNRKILNGFFESLDLTALAVDIMRIIDKIEKIGEEKVLHELEELGVEMQSAKAIIDFVSIDGNVDEKIVALKALNIQNETFICGVNELEKVVDGIRSFGVPDDYFTVDLKIARGLDYYTGTVYETFLNDYRKIGSVCSGGRYENLAEFYTDKKLPGVGISIGLTRLFYQLNEMNLVNVKKKSISDVLVVPMGEEDIKECLSIATQLRENDINTEVYMDDKKMKAKLKYADRLNIPYAIIVGETERQSKKYAFKALATGEQDALSVEEIVNKVKENI